MDTKIRLQPKTQPTTIIHDSKKKYSRKRKGTEIEEFQRSFYNYI